MPHLYNFIPLFKIKPDKLTSWDEKNDLLPSLDIHWKFTNRSLRWTQSYIT